MERSPTPDRGGAADRQPKGSPQAQRRDATPLDPGQPESGSQQTQQQSPRTPEFAPGEDGECH